MGYQTDFVGYFHIDPPLNSVEVRWVNDISGSHAFNTGQIPEESFYLEDVVRTAFAKERVPSWWSNWEVCSEGCCLSYDGGDKANQMAPWIRHLLATYLTPGAEAQGEPGFEEFTFDHMINGMVVGSRRDNRELYAITIRENEIEVEILWPGVPEASAYSPLAYQTEIDRVREWSIEHRLEGVRKQVQARRLEWFGDAEG